MPLAVALVGQRHQAKPALTETRSTCGKKGVALPKGQYKLAYLGTPYGIYRGGAVYLSPSDEVLAYLSGSNRSTTDFLIHGPGRAGSEGCRVFFNTSHYSTVMSLFRQTYGKFDWTKPEDEKWHGILEVVDETIK